MRVKIGQSKAAGSMTAPPSKSMAHRYLICSGLCAGESIIRGIDVSEDVSATVDCLRAIGVKVYRDGETVHVIGTGSVHTDAAVPLPCRESGSTQRFFVPLCLLGGGEAVLTGEQGLFKRPLDVYQKICREQGIRFEQDTCSLYLNGTLTPGEYKVKGNISSQFISGLLFALPLLQSDSKISILPPIESRPYINLTISALKKFGVEVKWADEKTITVKGNQSYTPCETAVEGDYSNAAFFAALNALGSSIDIGGLDADSLQGDKAYERYLQMLDAGTPTIHLGDCPDLGPILMAVAAAKNGAVFDDTRRLKIKESDRGSAMAQELKKFGTSVTVYENSIVVYPADFHQPDAVLCGHNDHRIVMSLSVLATRTGGIIEGAEAVKKSLPDFFERLKALGIEVEQYDI
ncbi:MAG: 3-phosphoshikimate 1-carboxyvinyltransferase [Clostridia bacterium]|nr:3-phosphoshikimate 1-carboxyvinyltransferase [Clostridia bacterium]